MMGGELLNIGSLIAHAVLVQDVQQPVIRDGGAVIGVAVPALRPDGAGHLLQIFQPRYRGHLRLRGVLRRGRRRLFFLLG